MVDAKSREKLFMEAFERKELVCSHVLAAMIKGKKNTIIYPLCVQTYEDGYELFWYCDECISLYGLSASGTYVFDAEGNIESSLNCLEGFKLDENADRNPFSLFIEEQGGNYLKKAELQRFINNFCIDKPLEMAKLERIPFGARWVNERSL